MSALDLLSQKNGLKTTQAVVNKQTSGQEAVQKAQPETPTFTMEQLDAMKKDVDKQNTAVPKDETLQMKEARTNTIAYNKGLVAGRKENPQIPVVKEEVVQPKQMSYADMFQKLSASQEETPEQKARREKREKTRATIAAIGDGLRALSNVYFATQGAKVVHDPNSDMTTAMAKRKALLDEQRKKNNTAWQNGYLKALALDEEAKKNKETLAETVRYHNQLANNRDRVGDQKDRSLDQKDTQLDQSQQRIDLSKLKYTDEQQYKKDLLAIKQAELDGKLTHWAAQNAIAKLREGRVAAKASASSGGKNTTQGYWYEYYDMMDSTEGQKKINELKRKLKIKSVTQTNVRYLMDILKGRRKASTVSPSVNSSTTQKTANKPSAQKVKTTAVNGGGSSSRSGKGRTLNGIK